MLTCVIYIYTYIHTNIYIYICICATTHTYIHACIHAYRHICIGATGCCTELKGKDGSVSILSGVQSSVPGAFRGFHGRLVGLHGDSNMGVSEN